MTTARRLQVDLNADVGEGFGVYDFGEDAQLLDVVSSANIACGFHAGDPTIMRRTVERCVALGVAMGAHPGLPDRMGFGRREMALSTEEAVDGLLYQVGALQAFVHSAGGTLQHVKPHGALYHMAAGNADLAQALVHALAALDNRLLLYGPPKSRLQEAAERLGVGFVAEGFADRGYLADGRLAPRGMAGAMMEEAELAAAQAILLVKEARVRTVTGEIVDVSVRTICLHGDNRQAAARARHVADELRAAGITIAVPGR